MHRLEPWLGRPHPDRTLRAIRVAPRVGAGEAEEKLPHIQYRLYTSMAISGGAQRLSRIARCLPAVLRV